MVTCATVMKSLLLAAILVALTGHGSAVEKLADCCTHVEKAEITDHILGFLPQPKVGHCVRAVIFQTEMGYYCFKHDAPWVIRKVQELMRNRARNALLLKRISSTSSAPSSAFSSSSSTSSS